MQRSFLERQQAIKPVLQKLNELRLGPTNFESIKLLYAQLQMYIKTGERIELNIPFPEYNCNIKGVLSGDKTETVWIKLEHIK
jgi:hypothetical protein